VVRDEVMRHGDAREPPVGRFDRVHLGEGAGKHGGIAVHRRVGRVGWRAVGRGKGGADGEQRGDGATNGKPDHSSDAG